MRPSPAHPTLEILRGLIPGALVDGETFVGELPHPRALSREARSRRFRQERERATETVLRRLVAAAKLPPTTQIPRTSAGHRRWPPGYGGSITHKGTVVLAAMARSSAHASIGIDLERWSTAGPELGTVALPAEAPPGVDADHVAHVVLSAKEAAFKAWFPIHRQKLGFHDITLSWASISDDTWMGTAICPGNLELPVAFAFQGRWVVSAAFGR